MTDEGAAGVKALAALVASAEEDLPGLREVLRVAKLPLGRQPTPEEVEAISRVEVAPAWFEGRAPEQLAVARESGKPVVPHRLWRQQVQFIMAFDASSGAHVSLRVGGGKSACAFLAVKHAHAPRPHGKGVRKSIMVVPSRGFRKLVELDVPKMRRILDFDVPVHAMSGLPPGRRLALARSNLPGVYCTTYALLQREQAMDELTAIRPELAVCDEAHVFAGQRHAAMKRRFFRMIEEFRVMCVWLSGTMSKKSFLDSWPMIVYALRNNAPVPADQGTAQFWASVLDATPGGRVSEELLRTMEPLRQWALEKVREGRIDPVDIGGPLSPDAEGMRRAYKARRNSAPGVVSSAEGELGTTISIANRPCYDQAGTPAGTDEERQHALQARIDEIEERLERELPRPLPEDYCPREAFALLPPWERMVSLLHVVKRRGLTPNGDEIDFAFHGYERAYELSAGFYNELIWPTTPELAAHWHIDEPQAQELLDKAREHRRAVSKFQKEIRLFLGGEHVVGLDTPVQIWDCCARRDRRFSHLPRALYDRWVGVQAVKFENMPVRYSREARVCDWKIRAAIEWARAVEAEHGKKAGGLVWAWNNEMLKWAHEIFLAEFGPDRVMFCPAGKGPDRAISDPRNANRFTIASIAAHCEIKDLFHFQHQVFLQVPRGANTMEQTLGRTHRPGQEADELEIRTLNTLPFDHANYSAMLHDSLWLSQAEARQKVVFADYDPLPRLYPSRFLQEHGFRLEGLGQDAQMRLVFGDGLV